MLALGFMIIVLLILNGKFLIMWANVLTGRRTLREQRPVLPGPKGLVLIGGIVLARNVIDALLSGHPWYQGLLLHFEGGIETWGMNAAFLILGYGLIAWGVVSSIRGSGST